MEISNPSDAEFKTLVIRMRNDFSDDLISITKIQSETKDKVIEIIIYRETTVEWMVRITSMIWIIRRQKTTKQTIKRKKIIQKKRG